MRIELRNLTKRFGRVVALDSVDLDIPSGRRVALIGPNGSGKSTLTRVLMGLLRFGGEARLDGLCPVGQRDALGPRMAYVPQIAPRFGVTVEEFVRLVTDVRAIPLDRVRSLASELDLDLATVGGRRFRDLSGGMRQKLLIALALAPRCELLILDEPTASLDARARERFFELFERESGEATLLLCSHRLEEIRHLVDHVVVLEEGRVARAEDARSLLGANTQSRLEVLVSADLPASQMTELGFRGGAGGWWTRSVPHSEKLSLLRSLQEELGEALLDLQVRDQERLDMTPAVTPAATPAPALAQVEES
jgi:ABC-2 type transport system ATP-binding protein